MRRRIEKNVLLAICSNGSPQSPGGMRHTTVPLIDLSL